MTRIPALAALLLASCAPSGYPPDLRISDAWARQTVPGQTATAAYLVIANRGGRADRLVRVAAPAPLRASLHQTSHSGGVARMRPIEDGLALPAGAIVALEPGGMHIMVENLDAALEPGQSLSLSLQFENSGERAVAFTVRHAGSTGPAHQDH